MPQFLSMVLAGGEGKRLLPLTAERAKPAVPFAGRYRIIDLVLSNLVNSGLTRIKVLTQYKSASLEEHVARAWRLSPILDNFIETIPAQQRTGLTWFRGSADAVWQCFNVVKDADPDYVAIFGGDHVYKMDVRLMIDRHFDTEADLTVAAIPVPKAEASAFGVLQIDAQGRVLSFLEKPADPPEMPERPGWCLVSMGNYIFGVDVLEEELRRDIADETSAHDFGKSILPSMVARGRNVVIFDFATNVIQDEENPSYWRDIGTIESYFDAQMDLVSIKPEFNLYNRRWPIRTGISFDPPAKFVFSDQSQARVGLATDSLVTDGCIISGGQIHRSVLANRVRVNSFAQLEECVLLEGVQVGRYARIRRAIVDKGVNIPPGMQIGFDVDEDRKRFHISDTGIIVIPKGAILEK
ncbi:MAG: glucose-1-phosphate adenylyltransferase [Myxococcales bacterium]|nr:glucose-1-phosphate adenylyltransferase [Myxococcales bacterium]